MGRLKYIECEIETGRINDHLEVRKVEMFAINSEREISPIKDVKKGTNKKVLRFHLQKGLYKVRVVAVVRGKLQNVKNAELILNEKNWSWKGLPPILDQCFRFSWHTQSK